MKSELLKYCRYYKGEEKNPLTRGKNKNMFWYYERCWVLMSERGQYPVDKETLYDYEFYGLKSFSSDDDVPLSLKLLLFNRFMHWEGGYGMERDREAFKQFYLQEYLER